MVELNLMLVTQLFEFEQEGEQHAVPVSEGRRLKAETPHAWCGFALSLYLCGRRQSSLDGPLPRKLYTQCVRCELCNVERTVGGCLRRCRIHAMCSSKVACYRRMYADGIQSRLGIQEKWRHQH